MFDFPNFAGFERNVVFTFIPYSIFLNTVFGLRKLDYDDLIVTKSISAYLVLC